MGIVFYTHIYIAIPFLFAVELMGIVFDTQAMCVSAYITHTPPLTVDGYRFRYLYLRELYYFCMLGIVFDT